MIKIIENSMIIDVWYKPTFLSYLPQLNRYVKTDLSSANAVLGSDQNTVYHIKNTDYNFNSDLKSVYFEEIDKEEYDKLTKEIQVKKENTDLEKEVVDLKILVSKQTQLIEQLLNRLTWLFPIFMI